MYVFFAYNYTNIMQDLSVESFDWPGRFDGRFCSVDGKTRDVYRDAVSEMESEWRNFVRQRGGLSMALLGLKATTCLCLSRLYVFTIVLVD